MRKFIFYSFLSFVFLTTATIGTVAVIAVLACSQPAFYAKAISEPIDQADAKKATQELERIAESLEVFIQLGDATPQDLEMAKSIAENTRNAGGSNAKQLETLTRLVSMSSNGSTSETFPVTLTERHLNALLVKEMGGKGKDWSNPRIALHSDQISLGATVESPAGEIVLSSDFKLSVSSQSELTLELHAVRCGKMPLPAATLLKQFMKTNPDLPKDVELDTDGRYPTFTFKNLSKNGKLLISDFQITDGKLHLSFRRAGNRRRLEN